MVFVLQVGLKIANDTQGMVKNININRHINVYGNFKLFLLFIDDTPHKNFIDVIVFKK